MDQGNRNAYFREYFRSTPERKAKKAARAARRMKQIKPIMSSSGQIHFLTGRRIDSCRVHGITPEQFVDLIEMKGGRCHLCAGSFAAMKQQAIHIDHCHKTKRVRGVLCSRCNTSMIGRLERIGLDVIIAYLSEPEQLALETTSPARVFVPAGD